MAIPAENVATVNVFGNVGSISEFKAGIDNWDEYKERLDQYFLANGIPANRQVCVLLTVIGAASYSVLRDLCDPELPSVKEYAVLAKLLHDQFAPKIMVFRKRTEFHNLTQKADETVGDWYRRIKNMATHCKFGGNLEMVIKDRFVAGMRSGKIQERLFEEDHKKKLTELMEIAQNKESVLLSKNGQQVQTINYFKKTNNYQNIEGNKSKQSKLPNYVNKGCYDSSSNNNKSSKNSTISKATCNHCGKTNHNFSQCKFKGYKCRKCNKTGHIQSACKTTLYNNNLVAAVNSIESLNMFNLNANFSDPIIIKVKMENVPMDVEVDTGSGISAIPESIFVKSFSGLKIKPARVVLKAYDGKVIEPVGQVSCNLTYGNATKTIQLLVIKNGIRPLVGRDFMNAFNLGLQNLNQLRSFADIVPEELKKVLEDHKEIFEVGLGKYSYEKVTLQTKPDIVPIFRKPRPIAFVFKDKIEEELNRLEREGVISKVLNSKYGTPLVPVVKSNGSLRICADYKSTINPFLEDFNYPLPKIEELFLKLRGGKIFSKLDFRNAYNQLELSEDSRELLTWSTHKGLYRVNRLPYGTKPACQLFQSIVDKVLQGLDNVVAFLDDIVVTGVTTTDHLANLRKVLTRLNNSGFRLNLDKCSFFQREIKYLGHIISEKGLQKDPSKIEAIVKAPVPQNVAEVRSFVGLINYYGKFVVGMSQILAPLYNLLKKGVSFVWNDVCAAAFKKAKEVISSDMILCHYDPKFPIKLYCDASEKGIGAVLAHIFPDKSEKPICFVSRTLNKSEKNYSVIHKEALGIFWGVKKLEQYLLGRKFILCSDHKPLLAIFGEKRGLPAMTAGRLQRWATYLSEFNYEMRHISGFTNMADMLSRMPISVGTPDSPQAEGAQTFNFIENGMPVKMDEIKDKTRKDPVIGLIVLYMETKWPENITNDIKPYYIRRDELHVNRGVVMWGYRVIIPRLLQPKLLESLHAVHTGIAKMKATARSYFWWPGLDEQITQWVNNCSICVSERPDPPKAKLIKWRTAEGPWDRIHIDFLGPFQGKEYLIITDAFTKFPEVFIMPKITTTETIERLRETFARYGLPNTIVSDNGPQLTSAEFKNFCGVNGIRHTTSPPFHPSSNGAAENSVKSFKKSVQKLLKDPKNKGVSLRTLISRYLFSYRNMPHAETGESPAKLLFNRKLKNRFDLLRESNVGRSEDQIKYHKGSRDVTFSPGDPVYVKDYRHRKPVWTEGTIVENIGQRLYLVRLKNEALMWRRHVDQIIPGITEDRAKDGPPPYEIELPIVGENVATPESRKILEIPETRTESEVSVTRKEFPTTIDTTIESPREQESSLIKDNTIEPPESVKDEGKPQRPKRNIKPPERLNL